MACSTCEARTFDFIRRRVFQELVRRFRKLIIETHENEAVGVAPDENYKRLCELYNADFGSDEENKDLTDAVRCLFLCRCVGCLPLMWPGLSRA